MARPWRWRHRKPATTPNILGGTLLTRICCSANWAFNTALGAFVPPAFANIRYETYIIFGVFLFVMTLHVFFLFPETAGKTLEDTAAMFEDPNGIRYIGTPAWKTKVETSTTSRRERGEGFEKKVSSEEESPERKGSGSPERKESV